MAAGYVDDHKLILYRSGAQPRDITAFASDMTLTDDLDTLAAELTFTTFISPWDKYTPKLALARDQSGENGLFRRYHHGDAGRRRYRL